MAERLELNDDGDIFDYTENLCGSPLIVSQRRFVHYRNSIANIANPTKKRRKKKGIRVHYTSRNFDDWVV